MVVRAAKSFINLLPTRRDSVPQSRGAEIKPVPEHRLQPAFQELQENAASEKVGDLECDGSVVSVPGVGFSL